jgi:hypothetical protein
MEYGPVPKGKKEHVLSCPSFHFPLQPSKSHLCTQPSPLTPNRFSNTPTHSLPVLCPGHPQLPQQRGIITYRLSPNQLRPLAGAGHAAVFNTARRTGAQVWYVLPPFVVAWWALKWAEER